MKKETYIYILAVLAFCFIIIYSILSKTFYYIADSATSIIVITILFLLYHKFNLNKTIFILIFLAMLFHNLGIFGFYGNSPFPFPYDNLTHFVGGFSLSIFFINYIKTFFKKSRTEKAILILIAVLAALGIGSIIEMTEYIGYLTLGQGEGFLYFGGTGDVTGDYNLGGAWINSSVDMLFNLIGALSGLIVYFIYKRLLQIFRKINHKS
ncbi:DUF2238 domain-containing protein [Candidatus Woesearchaeota archaeon]|nr:DUF2238 domain-containing protein [Candidatus Woesearchaeota archaeon]